MTNMRRLITLVEGETAFRQWFGHSKVVDAAGEPLIVFHGTADQFDAFDPGKSPEGFFFTDDRMRAELYGEGGRIITAYLSLQHPAPFKEYAALAGRGYVKAKEEMMRRGYDGVIWHDNDTTYVVFDADQIRPTDDAATQVTSSE